MTLGNVEGSKSRLWVAASWEARGQVLRAQ